MFNMSQDIILITGASGQLGTVLTEKLQEKFGAHRVFDSPLAEGGIAAIAMGMGLNGLRPVAEIQFADYIFPAYDQIVNEIAKVRHRSGGEFTAPLTFRTPAGGGIKGGHHHSQSPEAQFTHTPGLKVEYMNPELCTPQYITTPLLDKILGQPSQTIKVKKPKKSKVSSSTLDNRGRKTCNLHLVHRDIIDLLGTTTWTNIAYITGKSKSTIGRVRKFVKENKSNKQLS